MNYPHPPIPTSYPATNNEVATVVNSMVNCQRVEGVTRELKVKGRFALSGRTLARGGDLHMKRCIYTTTTSSSRIVRNGVRLR